MDLSDVNRRRYYVKNTLLDGNADDFKMVDRMASLLLEVIHKRDAVLTAFLNPSQRSILKILAGDDVIMQDFGGYPAAEKRRVYLMQDWLNLGPADYQVTACEVVYPQKFTTLTHSSILGSLLNSGIEADTFGDIITDGNGQWQFLVKTELVTFFTEEIRRIGRTQVKIKPIALKEVLQPKDDSKSVSIVAASLRLDAILAGLTGQSRRQIKEAIANNFVKLNWHGIKDSNIIVKVDDILSLRHFGRSQIMSIGTTKKGKYKVVLKLWQTKKHK